MFAQLPQELQEAILEQVDTSEAFHFLFSRKTYNAACTAIWSGTLRVRATSSECKTLESILVVVKHKPELISRTKILTFECGFGAEIGTSEPQALHHWEPLVLEIAKGCPALEVLDVETCSFSPVPNTGVCKRLVFPRLQEIILRPIPDFDGGENGAVVCHYWLSITSPMGISFRLIDTCFDQVDVPGIRSGLLDDLFGSQLVCPARELHHIISPLKNVDTSDWEWDDVTASLCDLNFTQLEVLHLQMRSSFRSEQQEVGPELLSDISTCRGTLRSLEIPSCQFPIDVRSMRPAFEPFNLLRELTLSGSNANIAVDLLRQCTHLQTLTLVEHHVQHVKYHIQGLGWRLFDGYVPGASARPRKWVRFVWSNVLENPAGHAHSDASKWVVRGHLEAFHAVLKADLHSRKIESVIAGKSLMATVPELSKACGDTDASGVIRFERDTIVFLDEIVVDHSEIYSFPASWKPWQA